MNNGEYEKLLKRVERVELLEKQLRDLCNLVMKIKRQAEKKGMWIAAGINPYVPLTDEAQQGPLVTSLYEKVEEIRKVVRKI